MLHIKYTYICDVCGKNYRTEDYPRRYGDLIPKPHEAWGLVQKYLCDGCHEGIELAVNRAWCELEK